MFTKKPLISGVNVDSVYVNNNYQDETQPLNLEAKDIQYYKVAVDIVTTDRQNIKISFNSLQDLLSFTKAYELK